ncbi:diadenylate cyclase [Xanthomonas campestris]|uniref:diadenylate cyclase n=1 Tax=Xanthomonas campestris TaxID=339 RepID=UPI00137A04E3|nr:diadenylate cyclase [Xanthomonas campestris]MCC5086722.1 diadenylate cyclase [Xanthomonas campestris]
MGLVLYHGRHALPHLALRNNNPTMLEGALGLEQVAHMLSKLACTESPWHDGFHFIDAAEVRLTHVAQFISPPIPTQVELVSSGGGARHMSGALASMIDGIYMVGILTSKGEVSLYVDGKRVLHEEMGL